MKTTSETPVAGLPVYYAGRDPGLAADFKSVVDNSIPEGTRMAELMTIPEGNFKLQSAQELFGEFLLESLESNALSERRVRYLREKGYTAEANGVQSQVAWFRAFMGGQQVLFDGFVRPKLQPEGEYTPDMVVAVDDIQPNRNGDILLKAEADAALDKSSQSTGAIKPGSYVRLLQEKLVVDDKLMHAGQVWGVQVTERLASGKWVSTTNAKQGNISEKWLGDIAWRP